MSESKARLQRENDRLRRVDADHALLVKAAREALWQLRGLVDKDVGIKTLEDAVAKMPAPVPIEMPPPRRTPSRALLTLLAAAAAVDVGIGGRRL